MYAVVNIQRYDSVLRIYSIQNNWNRILLNFILYNLPTIPNTLLIYVYIIALSITELFTVSRCLWIMFQMKFYMFWPELSEEKLLL